MLGLVSAHNTLQTYAFWELVGLGSYLLIGFWYRKPEAARVAVKAFWTTRLGDVGFAIGVVLRIKYELDRDFSVYEKKRKPGRRMRR